MLIFFLTFLIVSVVLYSTKSHFGGSAVKSSEDEGDAAKEEVSGRITRAGEGADQKKTKQNAKTKIKKEKKKKKRRKKKKKGTKKEEQNAKKKKKKKKPEERAKATVKSDQIKPSSTAVAAITQHRMNNKAATQGFVPNAVGAGGVNFASNGSTFGRGYTGHEQVQGSGMPRGAMQQAFNQGTNWSQGSIQHPPSQGNSWSQGPRQAPFGQGNWSQAAMQQPLSQGSNWSQAAMQQPHIQGQVRPPEMQPNNKGRKLLPEYHFTLPKPVDSTGKNMYARKHNVQSVGPGVSQSRPAAPFRSCQARVNLWDFMVFDNSCVERIELLGQGAYAEVYDGKVRGLKCAIKLYRRTASEKQLKEAMGEIRLMASLEHPCTLRLIGWVRQPLQTITELCLGDLKDFYKDEIEGLQYSEFRALMLLRVGCSRRIVKLG